MGNDSQIGKYTFRLFKSRPTFIQGVGSLFDFGKIIDKYNVDSSEKEADARSLEADWFAVGDDIRLGMSTYERSR